MAQALSSCVTVWIIGFQSRVKQPNLSVVKKSAPKLLSAPSNNHPSCAQTPKLLAWPRIFQFEFCHDNNPCMEEQRTDRLSWSHSFFIFCFNEASQKVGLCLPHTQSILLPKSCKEQQPRPETIWRTTQELPSVSAHGNAWWYHRKNWNRTAQNQVERKLEVFLLSSLSVWQKEEQSCIHPPQQQQIPDWTSAEGYFARKTMGLPCLFCFCLVWGLSQYGLQIVQQRN